MVTHLAFAPFYFLCLCYVMDPEEFEKRVELAGLRLILIQLNAETLYHSWRIHRKLAAVSRQSMGIDLGPFPFFKMLRNLTWI